MFYCSIWSLYIKKLHTCEGVVLASIDELEKQIIIKKLLNWANKKQNDFIIYKVALFWLKKIKKNTCRYHDMIYSSWDIEQNILKLVILGHFFPFYPFKNPKNQNFVKWKNLLEISSFYTCVPKITFIWCTVPEIRSETDNFLSFSAIFYLFTTIPNPLMIPKIKILEEKWKKCLEILSFYTYVYHK